ncbi:MAG TPA: sigma-70 family RNA polymerase sigma factor [Dongiaceae bacterium]|nr:sigma-70 family RNA polymerase sigma factor [Dongiaceae bacterium]
MQSRDDSTLLREFAEQRSDAAFTELVSRHVNLVYSVAMRHTGNPHHAEEITQAVFVILARKVDRLLDARVLSSWLFQTTRLTANNFMRSEARRARREQELLMQSGLNESGEDLWPRLAPVLDAAVAGLGEKDRRAIVLRFYEGRNLRDVGVALGASEAAAEKRVNRALEKLRRLFTKRGLTLTTTLLAGAISTHAVHAAPAGLASGIAGTVVQGSALTASTSALVNGVLKWMAWAQLKTAGLIGTAVVVAVTTAVVVESTKATDPGSLDAKIEQLSRPGTTVAQAIQLLGEPREYAAGTNVFTKNNLPATYLLVYPGGVEVAAGRDKVTGLRSLRPGPGFHYHGKLQLGATLDEVLAEVGPPARTETGHASSTLLGATLGGEPGVLYAAINNEPGYCYYWRPDQNVRFIFRNNRVIALLIDVRN